MRVLVIGANGKTGRIIVDLLAEGPHEPVAMLRSRDQFAHFEERGIVVAHGDLEQPLDPVLETPAAEGCEAVIFAAGSGSATGPEKTLAVDRDGAIRTVAALESCGIDRFVMLSSLRADPNSKGHPISHYLRAKGIADAHIRRSELDWTIVRPGRLTEDEGTGRVALAPWLDSPGSIPRTDTAAVLVGCLDEPGTIDRSFDVVAGEEPIDEALLAL